MGAVVKCRKQPTSPEVYAVLYARHREDLTVHSSFTAPDGWEGGFLGEVMTEWGFRDADVPLMGSRQRWERTNREGTLQVEHWLCVPQEQDA